MKIVSLLWLSVTLSLSAPAEKTLLRDGWQFSPDESHWAAVTLPYTATSQGWYRRTFEAPRAASEKHVRVGFEITGSPVELLLNGERVGERKDAAITLEFDLTPALRTGMANTLLIHMEKPGTLRDVSLLTTGRVFPVRQKIDASPQRIAVSLMVRNTLDNTSGVQVNFEVWRAGKMIASTSTTATVPPNLTQTIEGGLVLKPEDVKLWDPDHPNVYQLRTTVMKNAEAVEGAYETEIASSFGIRTVAVRGPEFLLNGEPVRLGGADLSSEPNEQQLRSMKEAGMVFLLSRTPASPALLDWADQNGMLVVEDEALLERDEPAIGRGLDGVRFGKEG